MKSKKILHVQIPDMESIDRVTSNHGIIAGSLFCHQCRIDKNAELWSAYFQSVKQIDQTIKIYVQQPFYLVDQSEKAFLNVLSSLISKQLIDGIIVNSPGMASLLNQILDPTQKKIRLVFSRLGIRKRRRTNRYLIELLREYKINDFECYSQDHELIDDIVKLNKGQDTMKLWIREGSRMFHSFSKECFIELFSNHCNQKPELCGKGLFTLERNKENLHLKTSGHILYDESECDPSIKRDNCDAIIVNSEPYEL